MKLLFFIALATWFLNTKQFCFEEGVTDCSQCLTNTSCIYCLGFGQGICREPSNSCSKKIISCQCDLFPNCNTCIHQTNPTCGWCALSETNGLCLPGNINGSKIKCPGVWFYNTCCVKIM